MRRFRALLVPVLLAWLASPCGAQARYRIVDVGALPGSSSSIAFAVNDLGDVAGVSTVGNAWQGFLYTDAQGLIPLGSLGRGSVSARDVSELRDVVGESGPVAYVWSAAAGMRDLTGGLWSRANAVNNAGLVAGTLDPDALLSHTPFLFDPAVGVVRLAPGQVGRARDVNEVGQVVGWAGNGVTSRAFRFTPGQGMQWLTAPPGLPLASPEDINERGEIAGTMSSLSGNTVQLFLYTDATGFQDLGSVGKDGTVGGFNDDGVIVGTRDFGVDHAFVYTPGRGIENLNALIPPGSGYFLTDAFDVNNPGQIAALAYDNNRGMFRAVRLDPVAPAASVRRVANGCGGGATVPVLAASPPVMGGTTTLDLSRAAPLAPAAFVMSLGPPRAGVLPNGCASYVDLAVAVASPVFLTDAAGRGALRLPVPAGGALLGLPLSAQAAVLGAGPPRLDVSNGLLLVLGS